MSVKSWWRDWIGLHLTCSGQYLMQNDGVLSGTVLPASHSFNLSVQWPFIQTWITRNVKKSYFLIGSNTLSTLFSLDSYGKAKAFFSLRKECRQGEFFNSAAHMVRDCPRLSPQLTCKHSRPYRSSSGRGSWVYLLPHRSSWAQWSVAVSPNRPCRCKGRTAARGCTPEARGRRTAARPCCTSIGYTNPTWWKAWCMLTRTLCAVSGTHRRCCKLWPHPGSGSLLSYRPQNLWRIQMFLKFNLYDWLKW